MDILFIAILVLFLIILVGRSFKGKKQPVKRKYSGTSDYEKDSVHDVFSAYKYELRIEPSVFTSLNALKLRGKIFDNQTDVQKLNLDPATAFALPFRPENDTIGYEERWTDGGYASNPKQLEDYYNFLEKVRTTFEDRSMRADDRFHKIVSLCKQNDQNKEYFKNLNRHYKAFPANLFYKELTKVDGIGDSTAYNLFNSGIKTLKELKSATDVELNHIPGIGKKTIQQIRNYFKNRIDLDDDVSESSLRASNEQEVSTASTEIKGVDKWNELDTQKGIVPDINSMGIRRSVVQILETTAIMSSSKNIDTILGRADFLRERITEIIRASKTPKYSSDLQYALDEYRSIYYNTDIQDWQMGIFTKPEEFDVDKFCAECLFEGFIRHFSDQQEQISNLKRESAIKNRYKKINEVFDSFMLEFDKEWSSKSANDFKIEKLVQIKEIKASINEGIRQA